jgi:hypothetical protein
MVHHPVLPIYFAWHNCLWFSLACFGSPAEPRNLSAEMRESGGRFRGPGGVLAAISP